MFESCYLPSRQEKKDISLHSDELSYHRKFTMKLDRWLRIFESGYPHMFLRGITGHIIEWCYQPRWVQWRCSCRHKFLRTSGRTYLGMLDRFPHNLQWSYQQTGFLSKQKRIFSRWYLCRWWLEQYHWDSWWHKFEWNYLQSIWWYRCKDRHSRIEQIASQQSSWA